MMPGSRKLSKVGGGVHLKTRVGPDSRDFFFGTVSESGTGPLDYGATGPVSDP